MFQKKHISNAKIGFGEKGTGEIESKCWLCIFTQILK
jgi:hypothetical protein